MADTTVTNEAAATTPTGAELVRIVQGGSSKKTTLAVAGHQFRGARARMSSDDTTQNLTSAGDMPFDLADFDTDSFWSAGSPTRLTIGAGKGIKYVELTGQVMMSLSTSDTWWGVYIRHYNSSNVLQRQVGHVWVESGNASRSLAVSTGPLAVAAGDYFVLTVLQETDNSVTIEGDQNNETFLAIHVIGMEPV